VLTTSKTLGINVKLRIAAAIRAELTGSNSCTALGITVHGYAPVLALCRQLIETGHDPARPLHVFRGDVLALVVCDIGIGARLTVQTAGNGAPRFGLDGGSGGAAASPIAWLARGRA